MAGRADASGDRYGINSAPSGAITIEGKFYGTAYTNQYDALFWMGQSAAGGTAYDRAFMLVFGNPADNMEVWALNSVAARVGPVATSGAWVTNTWFDIALTIANTTSGSALELFGNGVSIGTGTAGSANTYLAQHIEIGNDVNSDNAIDVRSCNWIVTNRVMTAEEILARQNMPFILKAIGAWGAWTLEDASAAGLRDWSGSGNDLTQTGSMTVHAGDHRNVISSPWISEDDGQGYDVAAAAASPILLPWQSRGGMGPMVSM